MKSPKQKLWVRLKDCVNSHKKISITFCVAAFVVSACGVAAAWFLIPTKTVAIASESPTAEETPAQKFYSPLTGVEVPDEATTTRQVTAIMIENSPASRPQSGVKAAGIIFEAIAEGGITRFATLHQEDRPSLIGPVRSLRPYYLDWIAPFDAAIAHVGGSANALATVRDGSFKDIDQFFNGAYYWRATDRYAPHNVYTSFDKLDALNQVKGYTSSSFKAWPRKVDAPSTTPNAKSIDIKVSSSTYNAHYDYDAASNSYVRYIGGAPSVDREAGQNTPKTVIAMKVPTQIAYEDGYREQMTTTGIGEAYVFQDGIVRQGFWRKDGQKNQLMFYDKSAHTIALNPGQTWITVTAPENPITWQ